MASGLAGASNNQTCTENELLTISLALALKRSDADRFLQIYDNSIPNSLETKKVEEIKERARELSEKSTEELENLRGDLQAGQNLVLSVFQNVRINGFTSGQTDTTEGKSHLDSVDRNHNCLSRSGRVGEVAAAAMTLKTDEKEETAQTKGADLGAIKSGNSVLKVNSPGMQQKQVLPDSASMNDGTMLDGNASGAVESRKLEAVDNKIHFGIKPRQKFTERPNDVFKPKGNVLGKSKAGISSEAEPSKKDNGPYPANVLLENSVDLIRPPKDADVKNCPPPELIAPQNQVSKPPPNEISPTMGHRSPLKRHGEQQKEVELQNVYDGPTETAYNFHSAERQCSGVGNENFSCFQSNQASCNEIHNSITDKISSRDGSGVIENTRKKKRKKKKKTKQGDNGTESTTEGEEVRSPPNGLIPPTSTEQTAASKRKTSGESTSEKEDLSGENETKFSSNQKTKHSKDSAKDKSKRMKGVEPDKRKKTEMKKKGHNEVVSLEVKKMPEAEDSPKQLATGGEDEEEEQDKSELEEDVFLGRRTRPEEDITPFRKLESEPDCRAAMSDPGENDEDHGGFNVVQYRKTRRREKVATSSNFYSNFRRGGDAAWDLRKSSSLPKEMCNYSSSRRRLGTNETEELVSTTTTTTTTASSRRDSLESDENSFEQKKQSGFSYASRLKANIGSGHVQSQKDGERESPNNPEGVTSSPLCQSNMKPKINSMSDSFDRTLLKSTCQEYKEEVRRNVPSSSLSTAMSLEVTASARKFDLNFPDLASAASSSKGESSSDSQRGSVQYLDLEYTKNSYAGRLKQSLWNSNTGKTSATLDDQSIKTTESSKETVGVAKDSSAQDASCSVDKEGDLRISDSSNKGGTKNENVRNLPVESKIENSGQANISLVETNCKADGNLVQADNETIDLGRGTESQPRPLNAGVPSSNPIWFGSLIVSEDGIVDLDESGKAGLSKESSPKPPTFHADQSALQKDWKQVDASDKKCIEEQSMGHVTQSKGADVTPGSSAAVSDGTVVVELLSGNKVNIDMSGMWSKTQNFNHEEVTEMLLRDWEATLKESRDFPESVCFANN